jgi:L-fuculose-phosphate aldolase
MSRQDVVDTYRRMAAEGLIHGTAGNVSVRAGRGLLVTPSSLDPDLMTPQDVCEIDLASGLVDPAQTPSSEWLLHVGVYRGTDAGAVVHTHSLAATAVSLLVDELPAVHYAIARLGGPVPVVPYATYGSEELAATTAGALREHQAAILQNHGTVTVGRDLREAYERATSLEWLCELYLRAAAVGDPHVLSADDLAAVRAQGAHLRARGYRLG